MAQLCTNSIGLNVQEVVRSFEVSFALTDVSNCIICIQEVEVPGSVSGAG